MFAHAVGKRVIASTPLNRLVARADRMLGRRAPAAAQMAESASAKPDERVSLDAFLPFVMAGAIVDGQYIGSTCNSAFLFDICDGTDNDGVSDNDHMPLTLTPNALHTARDGKLHLAFGNVIHE